MMKKTIALLLILAFSLTLLACGSSQQPAAQQETETSNDTSNNEQQAKDEKEPAPVASAPEPAAEKNKVTLKTVSMFGGTDPNTKTYQALTKAFEATYPHVTVEDDSTTSNEAWKTRVAADFAVDNVPDVIFFFTDANAVEVLKSQPFVTVDEIRAEYPDYGKDIKPDVLANVTAPDGNIYALPLTGYYEGLFCNKDLFDQFGLELPTDWDKLLTAIETFKANDIIPIAVSLNEVPHYWIEHLILSAGGVEDHKLNPKDSVPESWVAGLDMFKTLRDMGAFPADTDVVKNADIENMFKTKKAAMQLDGSWFANGIDDKDNTTIVPFPVMPGGKKDPSDIIAGFSSGFYITKKAWDDPDKRQAAVDFVMLHTSLDSIGIYWGGAGTPAAACTPPDDLPPLMKDGATMAANANGLDAASDSRLNPEAFKTLVRNISDISNGRKTSAEVMEEIVNLNK